MKTGILTIGTEILIGKTVNTNASFLSDQLNKIGFDVFYHHTVGDNNQRLKAGLEYMLNQCDVVVSTGGLGPTQDDITKEVVSAVMGCNLCLHEDSETAIREYFIHTGREMTENNLRQAYIPSGAVVFPNTCGTAPGFAVESGGKILVCLPGPPREVQEMWEISVEQYLGTKGEGVLFYRDIRMFGIGESQLETLLMDIIEGQSDPSIATYAGEGECYLRVASKRDNLQDAENAVENVLKKILPRVDAYVYSQWGENLQNVVAEMLMKKGITISTAESCTGGLFAKSLTDIPGISEVFNLGVVTYSNSAKMKVLGVEEDIIEKYGAVSEETAIAMVEGLEKLTNSHICISVTGVAGPAGGSEYKPVGLAYIGIRYGGVSKCHRVDPIDLGRSRNRNRLMLAMMNAVYREMRAGS